MSPPACIYFEDFKSQIDSTACIQTLCMCTIFRFSEQFLPHTRAQGYSNRPVYLSVAVIVTTKSPDLNIQASEQLVSITNQSKSVKNWLECASNHLAQSTSITNSIFIILLAIVATPIDHTHQYCRPCAFYSCAQLAWQRSSMLQCLKKTTTNLCGCACI